MDQHNVVLSTVFRLRCYQAIIDGNGVIKEYYNGVLIYEGDCLNGKRHGMGKEYDFLTGKLKYEGRFAFGHKMYNQ